jgi:hypothetical protein
MRGSQTLFAELLIEDEGTLTVVARNVGRDKSLLQKRDNALIHRHYFYLKIKRLQYQDILDKLSEEFFIAQYTIIERLQMEENHRLLRRIITNNLQVRDLRKLYPFLVWE